MSMYNIHVVGGANLLKATGITPLTRVKRKIRIMS